MKKYKYILIILGLLPILFFFSACDDDGFARKIPKEDLSKISLAEVSIKDINQETITDESFEVSGTIEADGRGIVRKSGFCWGTTSEPTIDEDNYTTNGPTIGEFSSLIRGLKYNTKYYVRSYALNAKGVAYSDVKSITTTSPLARITTLLPTEVTKTSITMGGNITEYESTVLTRGLCWAVGYDPTVHDDTKTIEKSSINPFTHTITDLQPGVLYRIRAYAINSSGTTYGDIIQVRALPEQVKDIDGNIYHAIVIGSQTWMLENLKVTKFSNGDEITDLIDHPQEYIDTYGRLYSGHAATDMRNIAPNGWRVPTDEDWHTLISYSENNAGNTKEEGTAHWLEPNVGATNSTGFTALPGGLSHGGGATDIGSVGVWWTQTSVSETDLWRFAMVNNGTDFYQIPNAKDLRFSIRLIKE